MSTPARPTLRVGVIGAGRVGAVLGAALRQVGHEVVAVAAVSAESRERAEMLLPGVPVMPVPEVVAASTLVVLAVPDDSFPGLVSGIAETAGWRPGQLVVHTSGRHALEPLAPVAAAGGLPLAIHPAMTFTGTSLDLARLPGCCFGVTTAPELRPVAEALVVELGGEPIWVPPEARPLYHAALAHGSNHLVTLVSQALEILRSAGIEDGAAVLRPLLQASLDNTLASGDLALTGPVMRGDADTVAAHVHDLGGLPADIPETYVALARATTARAVAHRGLRSDAAAAVRAALAADQPNGQHPRATAAGQPPLDRSRQATPPSTQPRPSQPDEERG